MKLTPPVSDRLKRRIYVIFDCSLRANRHPDGYPTPDSSCHQHCEATALDFVHNLLVQSVKQCLNYRIIETFRQIVRQIAEAVEIQHRFVKHLEIRMLANEIVQLSRQPDVLRKKLAQSLPAKESKHHPDFQRPESTRHLRAVFQKIESLIVRFKATTKIWCADRESPAQSLALAYEHYAAIVRNAKPFVSIERKRIGALYAVEQGAGLR